MGEWVKKHPYLTGIAVLLGIILFFVFRRGGSSTQVQTAGPSEALQAANLQAGIQQQQINAAQNIATDQLQAALAAKALDAQTAQSVIAANVQTEQAKTAAALQASNYAAGTAFEATQAQAQGAVDVARLQTDSATAIATAQANVQAELGSYALQSTQINASRDVTVAGIQADLGKVQSDNAVTQQKIISDASVQINSQNTNRDIAVAGIDATAAVQLGGFKAATDQAQIAATLAELQDTNATAITVANTNASRDIDLQQIIADNSEKLAGISAGIQQANINATQEVYDNFLSYQGQIANNDLILNSQAEADRNGSISQILALIQSGQINKGGEGGINQVAVLAALLGQPGVVAPAASVANKPSIWDNFFAGLGAGIGKGVTTAVH